MSETNPSLSELEVVGIARALSRETRMPIAPTDIEVLAIAPVPSPRFGTDEFAVAVRVHGKTYALSGSETGWSMVDRDEGDRWIMMVERYLALLRGVRQAAFESAPADAVPQPDEDVQRWAFPIVGWQHDTLPSDDLLYAAVGAIVAETEAKAVYLIGSLARGDAQPDSDIDLFVVVADDRMPQPAALQRLQQNLREHGVLFDVRGCRRSTFEANRAVSGTMSNTVAREGLLLYGMPNG
ncbi:nucleotidyltransferase domain-containing protein [Azospirillum canadense]|uniref:nucleotidyltransferase domain-containing protein n=1 Tax=Azospirillum canadense TaxID=403962 RepID=UPI002226445A|nr:nucleotidyltransferase domain-containing protein [Azospirillum canadense]MCW2239512.1 putative nucleotidyltransferase [Azospirillum canadense]